MSGHQATTAHQAIPDRWAISSTSFPARRAMPGRAIAEGQTVVVLQAVPEHPSAPEVQAVPVIRTIPQRQTILQPYWQPASGQTGFSLIEVSIVTAIVLLIAIVGIPAIGNYVIENKVPKVGEALQRFVARTKANAQGIGTAPYAGMGTGVLANALRDSSVMSVSGDGDTAIVAHNLGGNGTSGNGTVTLAPSAVAGGAMGSGFTLTLDHVSHAACPGIASVMQRMAEIIRVGGAGGQTVVKDATQQPPMIYNAALADARCARGDVNSFSFVIR